jgi:hypothetical protein
MISAITAAKTAPTLIGLLRPPSGGGRADVSKTARPAPLLSADPQQAAKATRKEMASRRLQSVTERMRSLSLLIKVDPRAALKMAAELACELRSAVKAYQDAGGRNVSSGDMALLRRQMADARQAQSAAAEAAPAEAALPVDPDAVPNPDVDARRAQQAYADAARAGEGARTLDRLDEMEAEAAGDYGFFEQVRNLVKGLRKARDDIRAASLSALRPPGEDDWKDADKAQGELERQVAAASAGISVRV